MKPWQRLIDALERWFPVIWAALCIVTVSVAVSGCVVSPSQLPTDELQARVYRDPATQELRSLMTGEPLTAAAKVEVAADRISKSLSTWGIAAVLLGGIGCAMPQVPNGLGLGLLLGGLTCILAGILLPAYSVYIGWGLVAAVLCYYAARLKIPLPGPLARFFTPAPGPFRAETNGQQ